MHRPTASNVRCVVMHVCQNSMECIFCTEPGASGGCGTSLAQSALPPTSNQSEQTLVKKKEEKVDGSEFMCYGGRCDVRNNK